MMQREGERAKLYGMRGWRFAHWSDLVQMLRKHKGQHLRNSVLGESAAREGPLDSESNLGQRIGNYAKGAMGGKMNYVTA